MHLARPSIALDSRHFGRGRKWQLARGTVESGASEDLKLFATTFAAGFVFVSLLLA